MYVHIYKYVCKFLYRHIYTYTYAYTFPYIHMCLPMSLSVCMYITLEKHDLNYLLFRVFSKGEMYLFRKSDLLSSLASFDF